jgi:hypothetical protein
MLAAAGNKMFLSFVESLRSVFKFILFMGATLVSNGSNLKSQGNLGEKLPEPLN